MAVWSLVNKDSAGAASQFAVVTTGGIVTTGANVIWVVLASYNGDPLVGDLTDSPAGTFSDSPNTWVMKGPTASSGDAALLCTTFYCIAPTTGTAHKVKVTPTGGGRTNFPAIVVFALTQGSAPTYVTSVAATSGNQAGSIGNANDLVCEGIAFYVNNGYSIGSSFTDLTEVAYGASIGVAGAWKQVTGAENPSWTPSGSNTQALRADSFTGTDAPGGGGGTTYSGCDGTGCFHHDHALFQDYHERRRQRDAYARRIGRELLKKAA